jgi:hypothetical protein
MSMSARRDPTEGQGSAFFELYDPKVEVIVTPGAQVLCGARAGDRFKLARRDAASAAGRFERSVTTATLLPKISR